MIDIGALSSPKLSVDCDGRYELKAPGMVVLLEFNR